MKTILILILCFELAVSANIKENEEISEESSLRVEGRDTPGEYIQQFLSSIGSRIRNLVGFSYVERKVIPKTNYRQTKSNTTVKLPTCHINSGICTSEGEPISCGRPAGQASGRIVNGSDSSPGAHPWAVQIWLRKKIFCSGTLITNTFVVSAAHCFNKLRPSEFRLVLGNDRTDRKSPNQESRRIENLFMRKDFVVRTYNNDIALIQMERKVVFTKYIRPICLPELNEDYSGEMATIIGWGRQNYNGKLPNHLKEAKVPVLPQEKCKYRSRHLAKEITENMLCAGYDDAHIDACQGDSGGPLIKNEKSSKKLIGIVSWGIECAKVGYPGVYTRLGNYLPWIVDIIQDKDSCLCTEIHEQVVKTEEEKTKENLQNEIKKLRSELEFIAKNGGKVIVDLSNKLDAKDDFIEKLEKKIRKLSTPDVQNEINVTVV